MKTYNYSLIRFVPNLARMEPQNVGVILRDERRIDYKLDANWARRGDADTPVVRSWKAFFEEEIRGERIPLFQPPKVSEEFFAYLSKLCNRTVRLSEMLQLRKPDDSQFDLVIEELFGDLVARTGEAPPTGDPKARPSQGFREQSRVLRLEKRGLRRHAHVPSSKGKPLWMAYRHCQNGTTIAVDKIEVNVQIGRTANEIQSLMAAASLAREFKGGGNTWTVLVDSLDAPFTGQSDADFSAMKKDMNRALDAAHSAGAKIIQAIEGAEELARVIDTKLPALAG
jgi:hypothetical protein